MYNPPGRHLSREKFKGAFRRSPMPHGRVDSQGNNQSYFQQAAKLVGASGTNIGYSRDSVQNVAVKRSRSKDYIISHEPVVFSNRLQNKENMPDYNAKEYQTSNATYGKNSGTEKTLNDQSSLGTKFTRPPLAESRDNLNTSKTLFHHHNLLRNRVSSRVFSRKPAESPTPTHKQFFVLESRSRPREHTPQRDYDSLVSKEKPFSTSLLECKSVNLQDLDIQKQVGKGSYAVVKLAVHKSTKERYAVKTYEKLKLADPLKKLSVDREISILQKLNHPSIIRYVNHVDSRNNLHLIMEYVGHKSLYEHVKSQPKRRLQDSVILKKIAEAMSYIHARDVGHRDLKLENILFVEEGVIKIIDFGFAIHSKEKQRTFCGTPTYMAPEIVRRVSYRAAEVDVWAMGIMMYRMLTGTYPFIANTDKELYKKIIDGSFDTSLVRGQKARDLVSKMLKVNPEERITAIEVGYE